MKKSQMGVSISINDSEITKELESIIYFMKGKIL